LYKLKDIFLHISIILGRTKLIASGAKSDESRIEQAFCSLFQLVRMCASRRGNLMSPIVQAFRALFPRSETAFSLT
jgi:hypothetical protein